MRNPDWVIRFSRQCDRIAPQAAGDSPARPDRRIAEIASGMDRQAGAAAPIRETGWLKAWRSDAVARRRRSRRLLPSMASKAGCSIARTFPRSNPRSCRFFYKVGLLHNPDRLSRFARQCGEGLRKMLAGSGGEVRQSRSRRSRLTAMAGACSSPMARFRRAMSWFALGPWSSDILRPLGYRVPWAFERGYHREYTPIRHAYCNVRSMISDGAFLMTPMENGIRVTSASN